MIDEMSDDFRKAYSAAEYDNDLAIRLYDLEINNDPKNFAAWNNRGVCKVQKGIVEKDKALATQGLEEIQNAIKLANEKDTNGYPIAEKNIKWAQSELGKL